MMLLNIVYAPKYNFNLILLEQLHKSGILYYNYPNFIVLKQKKNTLRVANKQKNLFVFKTGLKAKEMLMKKRG